MKRELTRRERWLAILAPGLVIIGLYFLLFGHPARQRVAALQTANAAVLRNIQATDQSILATRTAALPPISQARAELASIIAKLERQKQLAEAHAHPWRLAASHWTSPEGRIDALKTATSTLAAHGLVILSREQEADLRRALPADLADFAKDVQKDGNHATPQIWKIEFSGNYPDAVAAVDDMNRFEGFLFPLSIEMKPSARQGPGRIWILWVWV